MAAVYLSAIAFFEGPTPTFIGFSRCGLISGAVCGFILGIPSSFFLDMLRYWINKNETSADENFAANFSLSIFVGGSGGLIGTAGLYYVGKTLESNLPIGFLCVSNVLIGVALAIVIAIGVIRLFGKKKKKKKKRVQAKVVREKVDKTPQEW
jgi:phosphotransferase system  glucose/maltose/N-acetylglucosamine-specific IIC component